MTKVAPAQIKDILRYWRNTLADDDLMGLEVEGNPVRSTEESIRSGQIDNQAVRKLQDEWKKYSKQVSWNQTEEDLAIDYDGIVPVVIFMKGFYIRHDHGKAVGGQGRGRVHYTFYLPAMMDSTGRLSLASDTLPWIGRQYMTPNEEADENIPLVGDVADFDKWLTHNPLYSTAWPDVMKWCDDMWSTTTNGRIPDGFVVLPDVCIGIAKSVRNAGQNICQLYDSLIAQDEVPTLLARLCCGNEKKRLTDADMRRAAITVPRGMMGAEYGLAYSQGDAVAAFTKLNEGEILAVNGPPGTGKTTLLQSIIATEVVNRAIEGGEPAVIVGASTNNQAVTNINRSLNDILRENPVAAAFSWARRWVPDAETYGLYFPTNSKAADAEKQGFSIAVKNGKEWTGFPARESDAFYVAKAGKLWLEQFRQTYAYQPETVSEGLEALRKDVVAAVSQTKAVRDVIDRHAAIVQWWLETAGNVEADVFIQHEEQSFVQKVEQAKKLKAEAEVAAGAASQRRVDRATKLEAEEALVASVTEKNRARLQKFVGVKSQVSRALSPHGFIETLTAAVPVFRHRLVKTRMERLYALVQSDPFLAEIFENEIIRSEPEDWVARVDQLLREEKAKIEELRRPYESKVSKLRTELSQADDALRVAVDALEGATHTIRVLEDTHKQRRSLLEGKLQELNERVAELKNSYTALRDMAVSEFRVKEKNIPLAQVIPTIGSFDFLLDVTWRHLAFQKAMRYWEGRWIIEAQGVLDDKVNTKSGQAGMEARFRRWCMLTPFLIVTLHSLPKHFRFSSKLEEKQKWVSNFMLDFIDVLIIDEAGQVGPHIGAAAFGLAKRAVVVGDIYQIEPVVRVTPGSDRGNSEKFGLGRMWVDNSPEAPHLVSDPGDRKPGGSVMRLAQEGTSFVSAGTENEPGIFLSEHRRCRAEIVEYCNRLVYKGRLEVFTAVPKKAPPLPPLAWAHVRGHAVKRGGSNANVMEADAIANWIVENAEIWRLTDHPSYKNKPIEKVVAVITPFRPQADLVKQALKKKGSQFSKITVGTVHSLQGDQKPIVVFSPTYSDDTAGRLFFDRKSNMLNVAVSRAQDSFVVIGDMRLFRRGGGTPSSILGDLLFAHSENELADVEGNYRFSPEALTAAERISRLDDHRKLLQSALIEAEAGEVVVIASPWITKTAIDKDDLCRLVNVAVRKVGATVHIIVDRDLSLREPTHKAEEAIAALRNAGAVVSSVQKMHNKTLILRKDRIAEGSFNWLSASRDENGDYQRHETSWKISGTIAQKAIIEAIEEFRGMGADIRANATPVSAGDEIVKQ
ncbi:AAA domain-containing protein [Thalassospiraceae bacterium SW-3-3]|nr:AAA domain-containing protein [Thalassospiraceae bacterium SW-3-3]